MTDFSHTDAIALGSGDLQVAVSPIGAELKSLRLRGQEWLWPGDPDSWPRSAPILFPHCGRTRNREIRLNGRVYPHQPIHGFAPLSRFAIMAQTSDRLTLTLSDTAETRALYPFAFRLDVEFAVEDGILRQTIACTNRTDNPMPAAAGFHPGFLCPVPGAPSGAGHVIRFEKQEPGPVALPDADGLMGGATMPSPVRDGVLHLDDDVFKAGSAVFDRLKSRALWYGVPGIPGVAMTFDTPFLVLWRWPGPSRAHYLCIEPWAGLPDPADFAGDLSEKPGVTLIAPGETMKWGMTIQPGA